MEPIIRALLVNLVGEEAAENLQIVSNHVDIKDNGKWDIVYRDESSFGHDKSRAIRPYASLPNDVRPTLLYCGDGVSDLSAKHGKDLITYCLRESIPYVVFKSFKDIHAKVQALYENKVTLKDITS
jgi:2-hydroxy-3-keto-5-methylthiopentenyl-1-phosphate phosphatase